MEVARFEKRILGWIIDKAISWLFGGAILFCLVYFLPSEFSVFLEILLSFIGSYLFFVLFGSFLFFVTNGSSLGMLIAGIVASHPTREHFRYSEAFLRNLMTGLVAMVMVNAIYMLSIHTERSAFDRLTRTIVIERHPIN